jgi:hypothetical protein
MSRFGHQGLPSTHISTGIFYFSPMFQKYAHQKLHGAADNAAGYNNKNRLYCAAPEV